MQSETNVGGLLSLPSEMHEEILLSLPLIDLLNVCSTCKELHSVGCEKDAFWRRKTHAEFPGTQNRVSPSIEDTWKEEYKSLSRSRLSIQAMIKRMEKIDGRWWMYRGGVLGGFINTATYEELKDRLLNRYQVNFTVWEANFGEWEGRGGDWEEWEEIDSEDDMDEILNDVLNDVEVVGGCLAKSLADKHILVGRAFDRLIADKEIWS